jgi:hypothetical protein
MPKTPKNRNLTNHKRRSSAAALKLQTILRFGAAALRDKILDEELNKQAERCDVLALQDTLTFEATGALNAAREVAVALGTAYQNARLTGFNLRDWYRACGLNEDGELYNGLP